MSGAEPSARTEIGEGFVGSGVNAAHVNTVLGPRDGPLGGAFATVLGSPSPGHVPYLVVAKPNVPVQPPTLFVNKAAFAGERHEHLTWGAAQAGVAGGVADALGAGVIDGDTVGSLVLLIAVWVDPLADDEELVYSNNRGATRISLERGKLGLPAVEAVLAAGREPANPFFRRGP
ncbi:MAG: formaldehyde-activating enzyme [Acidimicrobiales bacterium]